MQLDRGNNYILVAYHYHAKNILTTPIKNRTRPCILSGVTKIHDKLRKRGLTPKLHIMDIEVSEDFNKYFEDSDIQFQPVPPHMYRINATERAVRTFNYYFIAALWNVEPCFPFYLWGCLFTQVAMTLNMLRRSRLKPGLSDYEQVDGIHNFERTSLATLGCKVQINEKPHKRLTHAPHSVDVWYLGTEVHHYICYTWYNIDTVGETTPDTIAFFPEFMKIPNYSSRGIAIHASADIEKALKHPGRNRLFKWGTHNSKQ